MKTITANDTNISRYIFDDDSNVIFLDTCIEVYNENGSMMMEHLKVHFSTNTV